MEQKKIIPVNYGLASNYGEFIEINEKLEGDLKEEILKHELSHTNKGYSMKDFKTDFQSKKPHFFRALLFCLKNPEALINYFPVMYSYHGKFWSYSVTSLFPFLYYGLIFSIFFLVLFRVNFFQTFIFWAILVFLVNAILLIYTDFYVKMAKKG